MLQVATGKLFTDRVNPSVRTLRGIVYTNLQLHVDDPVVTAVGTLRKFDCASSPNALIYEMDEYMEATAPTAGLLLSRTMGAYIDDFSDVASFALRAIVTRDVRVAERLLNQPPRQGEALASERLSRFYDAQVEFSGLDRKLLEDFSRDLIGLRRQAYLAVMQSIRTYVAAVHRLKDDLNLAYTMLVMAVESLTQECDGYTTAWEDVPDSKRNAIDSALIGIPLEAAQAVRDAVVEEEHLRSSRRFKQFILTHLPLDYFSDQADGEKHPAGRRDIEAGLSNLYDVRSKYVHTLKPLSREFLHFSDHRETYQDGARTLLTFQGLFRLVRAVIFEFVRQAEKVEHEPCNYEQDNPALMRLHIDRSGWMYQPEGLENSSCNVYLRWLIEAVDQCLAEYPDRKIQRPDCVLAHGFKIKPQLNPISSLAFTAFSVISDSYLGRADDVPRLSKNDVDKLSRPSLHALILAAMGGNDTQWDVAEHSKLLGQYYSQRFKPAGLKVPYRVEACLGLALAERYRRAGEADQARSQLVRTAEDFIQLACCRAAVADFEQDLPIKWLQIMYPAVVWRSMGSVADAQAGCDLV